MNDKTFVEAARVLAESVMKIPAGDDDKKLSEMYRRAIARPIDKSTLSVLIDSLSFFREHYLADEAQAKQLLGVGEAKRDQSLYAAEHAAMTAVAHVILNLDEFLTIE